MMRPSPHRPPVSAPAALTAFLRGVERRGALFALLQAGDQARADAALAAAMADFREAAAHTPFGDWARRFWTLLLAAPALRVPGAAAGLPDGLAPLAQVPQGPRAALLLRLVASLTEADAAAVLGVSRATYRLALHTALPRQSDGRPDEAGWRALADSAQQALRALSPARLSDLAAIREAALAGQVHVPATSSAEAGPADPVPRRRAWVGPAAAGVVVLTLAAIAWLEVTGGNGLVGDGPGGIRVEPLPAAQAPAATYDAALTLLTHPDFDLLLADGDEAVVRDPAFHAWLAAGQVDADAPDIPRVERDEDGGQTDDAGLEHDDAL